MMKTCNCDVCEISRKVGDLCLNLSEPDSSLVRELWLRMAVAEENEAWELSKRGCNKGISCKNSQSFSMNLPSWAVETLSIVSKNKEIGIEGYCRSLLLKSLKELSSDQELSFKRQALVSVLRNKLVMLQTVLTNHSHLQIQREEVAEKLVEKMLP